MSDELQIPQVPEPKPEDPEDVSWALSTAEAMWARGDHSEGVKWVRRAAEAAADAENDDRFMELTKAAADLAGMLTKRGQTRASIHIDDSEMEEEAPPPPPPPPKPPAPPKVAGPAAPKPAAGSVTKQVTTPSRPPAPLPSKTSQPPPAMGAKSAAAGKPLGTNTKSVPPKPMKSEPASDKKPARKSKANLEAEARAAGIVPMAADTSPDPVNHHDTQEAPIMRRSRPEIGPSDPTIVGNVNDILKKKAAALAAEDGNEDKTTDEWDAMATQNLTGDELNNLPIPPPPSSTDGRKTSVGLPPPDFKATVNAFAKPKTSAASAPASSSRTAEPHDPGVVTTQAVRVVLWRDGSGVHVAPAGTVVSAITVDAVLVALDSNADLTAWLTQKGR